MKYVIIFQILYSGFRLKVIRETHIVLQTIRVDFNGNSRYECEDHFVLIVLEKLMFWKKKKSKIEKKFSKKKKEN